MRAGDSTARRLSGVADRLLLDAKPPKDADRPGGHGASVRLDVLEGFARPSHGCCRAGSPRNVGEAIAHTGAPASTSPPASSRRPAEGPRPHPCLHRGREASRVTPSGGPPRDVRQPNTFRAGPDERGFFGLYGGRFVAETLMPLILELEQAYAAAKKDPAFHAEIDRPQRALRRPARARSISPSADRAFSPRGGAKIYFKRDELNHTGSHKINNCLGQILLARRMGKTRIIAETGAGQHGVAAATVSARFGLPCVVYMGATDIERQKPNVFRMQMLGAEIIR